MFSTLREMPSRSGLLTAYFVVTSGSESVLTGFPNMDGVEDVSGGAAAGDEHQAVVQLMVEKKASDLFFTCNAPVKIKIEGKIFPVNKQVLSPETVRQAGVGADEAEQIEHFNEELEIDFAISESGPRADSASTCSTSAGIPPWYCATSRRRCRSSRDLGMPEILKELVMLKRGLILMVGAAGPASRPR